MGAGASSSATKQAAKDRYSDLQNGPADAACDAPAATATVANAKAAESDTSSTTVHTGPPIRHDSRRAILAARRAEELDGSNEMRDDRSEASVLSLEPGELLHEITHIHDPGQLDALIDDCNDDPRELANIARESVAQLRRLMQVNRLARELSTQHDSKSQYAYIIRTLSQIVNADRAILYLVDSSTKTLRMQVARQFTSEQDKNAAEFHELRTTKTAYGIVSSPIPLDEGIPGEVARSGLSINIGDAYADSRFDPQIDAAMESKTVSLLAVPIGLPEAVAPIRLGRGFTSLDLESAHQQDLRRCLPKSSMDLRDEKLTVIGVVQLINKRDDAGEIVPFTADDQLVLEASGSIVAGYLTHMQLREKEDHERRRKEAILDIAVALGGTLDIRSLIWTVVDKLRKTFNVERCSLFFVDEQTGTLWTMASSYALEWSKWAAGNEIIRLPLDKGIVGYVARTGELLNVRDAYEDSRFNQEVDRQLNFKTRTILCGPIKNSEGKVVAVVQLINKTTGAGADAGPKEEPFTTSFNLKHAGAVGVAKSYSSVPMSSQGRHLSQQAKPLEMDFEEVRSLSTLAQSSTSIAKRNGTHSLAKSFRVHASDIRRRGSVVYGSATEYEAFDKADEQLLSGMFSMLSVAIANTELFSNSFIARHRLKCVLENVAELVITVDKDGMLMGCNRTSTEVNQLFGTEIPAKIMRTTKVTQWLPDEKLCAQIARVLSEAISDQRRARKIGVTTSDYTLQSGGHVVNYTIKPMLGMGTGLSQLIKAQHDAQAPTRAPSQEAGNMPETGSPAASSARPALSKSWSNFGSTRSMILGGITEEDTDLMEAQFAQTQSCVSGTAGGAIGKNDAENEVVGAVLCIDDKTPEQKLRSTLNKYLAPDLVDHLLHDGQLQLGGRRQKVTILFSDIRGFTTFSEQVGAQEIFGTLNEYFSCMVDVITQHGGIVDKFIGDALMAVFGVPKQSENDAYNACRAARAMEVALSKFNAARKAEGKPAIKIGIGISTGEVYCGNIGSENRFEYTVIGDAVNVASRLESSTKEFSVHNLISAATYEEIRASGCPVRVVSGDVADSIPEHEAEAMSQTEEEEKMPVEAKEDDGSEGANPDAIESEMILLREVDRVRVAGQTAQTQLFEILGAGRSLADAVPERTVAAIRAYSAGLQAYRARDIEGALAHFGEAADLGDGPACLFEERCEFLQKNPPGESWDGVWDMQKVSVWTYNPGHNNAQQAMDPFMRRLSRKSSIQDYAKDGPSTFPSSTASVRSLPAPDSIQEDDVSKPMDHQFPPLKSTQPRTKRSKSIIMHPSNASFFQ